VGQAAAALSGSFRSFDRRASGLAARGRPHQVVGEKKGRDISPRTAAATPAQRRPVGPAGSKRSRELAPWRGADSPPVGRVSVWHGFFLPSQPRPGPFAHGQRGTDARPRLNDPPRPRAAVLTADSSRGKVRGRLSAVCGRRTSGVSARGPALCGSPATNPRLMLGRK